jgi:hypothetical protein
MRVRCFQSKSFSPTAFTSSTHEWKGMDQIGTFFSLAFGFEWRAVIPVERRKGKVEDGLRCIVVCCISSICLHIWFIIRFSKQAEMALQHHHYGAFQAHCIVSGFIFRARSLLVRTPSVELWTYKEVWIGRQAEPTGFFFHTVCEKKI